MVTGLPAARIDEWWDEFKPFVERALAEGMGEWNADDIRASLRINDMQAWAAYDGHMVAAMVTQVVVYPRKKFCDIVLLAGERMADWMAQFPMLKAWAMAMGCDALRVMGRRGWLRAAKMNEFYTVMGVEL